MSGIDQLLAVARAYATAAELDLSTVSWRSLGDTKKLGAIVDGADIQVRRLEKTMQWFSDNWPDAPWPADVPRPARTAAEAAAG
jgi:hypothetical protein